MHQTQDVIELILDSSRNSLLTLDLQASIATMGLASGAFIAGLFGMNLHSSLEVTPYAFWITTGLAGGLVGLVTVGGLRRVTRLRRIGLGQGVFGEYAHPALLPHQHGGQTQLQQQQQLGGNKGLVDGYGKKALYYERSARKRREKQDKEYARLLHSKKWGAHGKAISYDG